MDAALTAPSYGEAVQRLRGAMRAHSFPTAGDRLQLAPITSALDAPSRAEGFHVLLEWEQAAARIRDIYLDVGRS